MHTASLTATGVIVRIRATGAEYGMHTACADDLMRQLAASGDTATGDTAAAVIIGPLIAPATEWTCAHAECATLTPPPAEMLTIGTPIRIDSPQSNYHRAAGEIASARTIDGATHYGVTFHGILAPALPRVDVPFSAHTFRPACTCGNPADSYGALCQWCAEDAEDLATLPTPTRPHWWTTSPVDRHCNRCGLMPHTAAEHLTDCPQHPAA